MQNNSARVVSGSKKYDHNTPVLKDLTGCPSGKGLRELLVKQTNKRTLRSNTKNLQIPHTKLKRFGDRAFGAYA